MIGFGMRLCAIVLSLFGTAIAARADDRPEVQIEQGRLAGTVVDGLRVFKGIPYALPPVGARRWRAPEPPARWAGTRDADAFGASCIQPPTPRAASISNPPAR
ncbi:carboxylesterase family protein [Sphingosinicella microcystinivorans]|uniref:carboxylesterase family protein n=1 Tax=Sphingosinicella microcystinivorans TaxID=335406 RepID=UPI0022F3B6DF|nr:carboxylesterase family protein [Sphingosinicella microcystinivorans]WBX84560.1 carboxylesterase family protein [Sphingosinicella microcystinivorans]